MSINKQTIENQIQHNITALDKRNANNIETILQNELKGLTTIKKLIELREAGTEVPILGLIEKVYEVTEKFYETISNRLPPDNQHDVPPFNGNPACMIACNIAEYDPKKQKSVAIPLLQTVFERAIDRTKKPTSDAPNTSAYLDTPQNYTSDNTIDHLLQSLGIKGNASNSSGKYIPVPEIKGVQVIVRKDAVSNVVNFNMEVNIHADVLKATSDLLKSK